MAYLNWDLVDELVAHDYRVQDIVNALRNVNRSSLENLSTLYSKLVIYKKQFGGKITIHGIGFPLRGADDRSETIWLTVSGCWSGSWQLRVLVGKSPGGFGPSGVEAARLELSRDRWERATALLSLSQGEVNKDFLMNKYGHKLKKATYV